MQLAEEEDKHLMIILMGIIREKLRTDPTFAEKLRKVLGIDMMRKKQGKMTIKRKNGKDVTEYEIGYV